MTNQAELRNHVDPIDRVLTCPRCGETGEPRFGWQQFGEGKRHMRADCGSCGRWIKWAIQIPAAVGSDTPW